MATCMHEEKIVMAKRTKRSTTLPREIIFQIAQFLLDVASFFAYIEAFQGTTSDQGSMRALWSLGQSVPQSSLWPNMELYSTKYQDWELAIQAIPLYATVNMHAQYDLHRLVDRVSPSTNLVVIHHDKPDPRRMRKWFRLLARLPVRGLIYSPLGSADRMSSVISHLCNVWPSLTHLRCLELTVGDQASLEAICKSIATSRITDLSLYGQKRSSGDEIDNQLEGVVLSDLVAWLCSTSVVRFNLYKFHIVCDDQVTMQALNGALAGSKSMQRLFWEECDIRISSPLTLPPRLQKLSLPHCTFELVGIDCMLKLLPTMPHLTQVRLNCSTMSPSDVDVLASVLARSNVSHLDLAGCSIGNGGLFVDCIQRLADAVEASESLRILNMADNELGFDGVKAILAAVERRPHVIELVDLLRNCYDDSDGELLDLVNTRLPRNAKIYV